MKKCDGWICSPTPKYKINKNILNNNKRLKIIVTPSTGSNHIDLTYCERKNIKVKTLLKTKFIRKIYASSEFTFALLLTLVRKIPEAPTNAPLTIRAWFPRTKPVAAAAIPE